MVSGREEDKLSKNVADKIGFAAKKPSVSKSGM